MWFGVAFLHAGRLWFLVVVEVAPCGWGWMSGLSRFLGKGTCISVLVGAAGFLLSGVQ